MESIKRTIKKHPVIFLLICIFVTAMAAYFHYTLKGSLFVLQDIGSDTKELYLPQYTSIVNHLRAHDFSFYDLTYGTGTSMYSLNLFHPVLMILYLLGYIFGPEHLASYLIVIHIISIMLAGLAAYAFLSSFRNLSLKSRLTAAYIYSFNGYIIIWGQHYSFSLCCILLPLLLCTVERSFSSYLKYDSQQGEKIRRSSSRALLLISVVSAVSALSSYYFTYMIMLAAAIYTVLRLLIMENSFLIRLKLLISRGAMMVLGVLMGLVYMLPSYMVMAENSNRISSEYGIFEKFISLMIPWPGEYYPTLIKRFISGTLEGNGSFVDDYTGYRNLYEDPQLFMSVLFILLFIQFLIYFPKIARTKRQRAVLVISILLGAFFLLIESGSLMFNGFVYPFSRHTFVLLPAFALLIAVMLDRIYKERQFSVIGGLAGAAAVCIICFISLRDLQFTVLKSIALAAAAISISAVAAFCIYTRSSWQKAARILPAFIALLAAVNILAETYSTVYNRATLSASDPMMDELYGEDFAAVKAYLQENDDSLYRLEKTYAAGSTLMDACAQSYYGISCYNSTLSEGLIKFYTEFFPEALYQGSEYRPCYRQVQGRSSFESLMGIKYILAKGDEKPAGCELVFSSGNLHLYVRPDTSFASFYSDTISEEKYFSDGAVKDIDAFIKDTLILDTVPSEADDTITGASSSERAAAADAVISAANENDGTLVFDIDVPSDGYLFIPVTYENGWDLTIDESPAEIERADFGFMASKISKGSHKAVLAYHVPYLKESACISLAALVLFIILSVILIKKRAR